MVSKVVITEHAQVLLDSCIGYVANVLDNKYAAKVISTDACKTRKSYTCLMGA